MTDPAPEPDALGFLPASIRSFGAGGLAAVIAVFLAVFLLTGSWISGLVLALLPIPVLLVNDLLKRRSERRHERRALRQATDSPVESRRRGRG